MPFSIKQMVILLTITEKKIFPHTFGRTVLLNWLVLEVCTLGMMTGYALYHSDGMISLVLLALLIFTLLVLLCSIPFGPSDGTDFVHFLPP